MKIKILFCHFDLGHGGAEKVLVNLLNCLDYTKYDVTLLLLFKHGVNLRSVSNHVQVKCVFDRKPFRGVTVLLKLFSPKFLHRLFIKEKYDIEIAYLEGAPTRIVSGCPNENTKLFSWVHTKLGKGFFNPYRSLTEAKKVYHSFNKILFVSKTAKDAFIDITNWKTLNCEVCHNVIDVKEIKSQAKELIGINLNSSKINFCSVGRLIEVKGYSRLIRILGELKNKITNDWHLYILGNGNKRQLIEAEIHQNGLQDHIHLLGYEINPYKYVSKMDLFICSSYNEGYSTAVTESIVLGIPVITTDCAGMNEIIGDSGAGIIVENSDDGLRKILTEILTGKIDIDAMKTNAMRRSIYFETANLKEFENVISGK